MYGKIMQRGVQGGSRPPLGRMERVSINDTDGYVGVDAQLDLAHGCTIVLDVVGDVVVDAVGDAVADSVGDAVADAAGDAVADAAGDAVADAAGDAVADAAGDAVADAAGDAVADAAGDAAADAAGSGVTTATSSTMKNLALVLGGAVMQQIVTEVTAAIKSATASSPGTGGPGTPPPPTSTAYWNALYTSMTQNYPCNNGSGTNCGPNVRAAQIAMVGTFQQNISSQHSADATAAASFEQSWTGQQQLKSTLTTMSATSGIPGMVNYLASYTDPGASGGALVIATANVLISVANYVFSDASS